MPRDSGGTYTLPAGNPVVTGTAVSSTWANNTLNDIVTALTGSLSRSGDGSMLAPLELDSGTLGAPGLCFGAETGLGLYRVSASTLGVAVGGVKVAQFDATGLVVPLAAAVTGNATVGGTLGVTGAATVGGTLGVTGVLSALASIELGHASDTSLARIAAGRVSIEGKEIANLTDAQTFAAALQIPTIELGHASDTTLARIAAGRVSIEGVEIVKQGDSLELGHASDTTLARMAAGRVSIEGVEIGTRQIRRSATTSGTLTAAESGYCVPATAGVTINPSVFATGDAVTIYNDSGAGITITQGVSMTLRQAGTANTGNRTLAQRGLATIWFDEHNDAVISGTGLT